MTVQTKNQGLVKYILLTWLLCGTLDALSAIIINFKVPPGLIFQYIASGVFGKAAFAGGAVMVLWGIVIHYFIALVFTFLFFRFYPFFINLFRNKILLAFVYGILIWVVMNLVIVPYLSHILSKPMTTSYISFSNGYFFISRQLIGILKNMAALIIAFGFPIAFIAGKYFRD